MQTCHVTLTYTIQSRRDLYLNLTGNAPDLVGLQSLLQSLLRCMITYTNFVVEKARLVILGSIRSRKLELIRVILEKRGQ